MVVMPADTPYSLTADGVFTAFDVSGKKADNGLWLISAGPFREMFWTKPEPVTYRKIRDRLANAVMRGQYEQIARLELSPQAARSFFLSDGFTGEQLRFATRGNDYFDIPNVYLMLGGMLVHFTLRIHRNLPQEIALTDHNGQSLT